MWAFQMDWPAFLHGEFSVTGDFQTEHFPQESCPGLGGGVGYGENGS